MRLSNIAHVQDLLTCPGTALAELLKKLIIWFPIGCFADHYV